MKNMSLQLNDAYMFVLWAGGLALQINLLSLSLSNKMKRLRYLFKVARYSFFVQNYFQNYNFVVNLRFYSKI